VIRRILTVVLVAAIVATLGGQVTALGAQKKGGKSSSTTTSTIPRKADPLLQRLLVAAGEIRTEDAKAAALSESYDVQVVRLKAAEKLVAVCDARVAAAERQVDAAKLKLRKAAILAYVTGQLTDINSPLLSNDANDGEMVAVYAGFAQDNLRGALNRYVTITGEITNGRNEALAAEVGIQLEVAQIATLRARAVHLVKAAARQYMVISSRLLKLVGARTFARLFSGWPAGKPYKGPDLAGIDAPKPASPLRARTAAATARKFLGVPYVWGGASKAGVDCSGLTMLAWAAAGVQLEHSATIQWEDSVPVSLKYLRPGDLLFYHFADDGNTPITHVVMYLGSGPYGAATAIQAARPGTNVAYTPVYFAGLVSAGEP
jgi:cell wall-associated NlpC family hydrolase